MLQRWMRIVSILMIIAMAITLLASCAKKDEEEDFVATVDGVVEKEENNTAAITPDKKDEEGKKEETVDPEKEEAPSSDQKEQEQEQQPSQEEDPLEEEPAVGDEPGDVIQEETPPEQEDDKTAPVEKETSGTEITFLSQNVLHAGVSVGSKGDGTGNNIYNRLRRFKSLVQANDPDVIFFNEARNGAIKFMSQTDPYFTSTYTVHWKYRWEGVLGGDQAEPVVYKTAKYKVVDSGHFWLSDTPSMPSKSFDSSADYGDISSWVILKDKTTGEEFYACCTHFSPSGSEVPIKAMNLHIKNSNAMKKDAYAFFGGDYNVYYRSVDYDMMMDWDSIIDLRDVAMNMNEDGLCELGGMASGHNLAYGNGEPMPAVNTKKPQIDYVMAKPNPHMAVDYYGFDYTIYDNQAEGIQKGHISDHWGLVVKVRIGTDADYSQYQTEHYYGDHPIYFNTELTE